LSFYKRLFGYFLIVFSLLVIVLIGFPQIYSSNSSGRIDKEIDVDFKYLKDETSDIVLLYFGYVGCDTICVPSMTEINEIYNKINNKNVKVYFINLLDNLDQNLPQLFAEHFNENFKGIYLDKKELLKVTSQLNVVFSKSLVDKYELNHAGYLYILQKDDTNNGYKQKYIYTTRPFKQNIIVEDINKLLKQGV